ncbi:MAG: type II secretion system protein [Smithellaceae bacterium]|jgi:prepilin-type N-terminal cleavage/methylation domain-containing protein
MIKERTMANHGYEPQSKLWKHFVLYPPLRPADGGIQLTNSDALRFRNWSFTNKKGFTLLEVIVIMVVAAIAATFLVNFMGPNLTGSSASAVRVSNQYALIGVVEKMNVDYNQLMNVGNPNVLTTLQSHIQAGNVVGNNPYFGQYTQTTKFIAFDSSHIEQTAASGTSTLKVTITVSDQTITTLFTQ